MLTRISRTVALMLCTVPLLLLVLSPATAEMLTESESRRLQLEKKEENRLVAEDDERRALQMGVSWEELAPLGQRGEGASNYVGKKDGGAGKKGYDASMSMEGKKGQGGAGKKGYGASMSMDGKKGGAGGKKGGLSMSLEGKKGGGKKGGGKKGGYHLSMSMDCEEEDLSMSIGGNQGRQCVVADGDDPCQVGCGHGMIPNPYNPNAAEAEKEPRPASCVDTNNCVCMDSGCAKSYDEGCIKWYMQCQDTQVCGSLSDAPTSVQDINIGSSCAVAPTSANTEFCFASQPPPTPCPPGKGGKKGKGGGKGGKKGGYGSMSFGGKKGKGGKKGGYGSMSFGGKKGKGGKKAGYDASMSMEGKKGKGGGGKKAGYDASMSMHGKKGAPGDSGKKGAGLKKDATPLLDKLGGFGN